MDVRTVAGLIRPRLRGEGRHEAARRRRLRGSSRGRAPACRQPPAPDEAAPTARAGRDRAPGSTGRAGCPAHRGPPTMASTNSAAAVIPVVEKHVLESIGTSRPSTGRASANSFSTAHRNSIPRSPSRATIRARNRRGQASYGARSRRTLIDEHHRRARRIGDHGERRRVGHQSDLADRTHPVHRLELVERVHRLHRNGEPDPGRHPLAPDAPPTPPCRAPGHRCRSTTSAPVARPPRGTRRRPRRWWARSSPEIRARLAVRAHQCGPPATRVERALAFVGLTDNT